MRIKLQLASKVYQKIQIKHATPTIEEFIINTYCSCLVSSLKGSNNIFEIKIHSRYWLGYWVQNELEIKTNF